MYGICGCRLRKQRSPCAGGCASVVHGVNVCHSISSQPRINQCTRHMTMKTAHAGALSWLYPTDSEECMNQSIHVLCAPSMLTAWLPAQIRSTYESNAWRLLFETAVVLTCSYITAFMEAFTISGFQCYKVVTHVVVPAPQTTSPRCLGQVP
jgi:hypothetical protein